MDSERRPGAIGRRIARMRAELGYRKASEFADAAGVDRFLISDLELGARASTSPENLRKIAATLHISVDALIAPDDDLVLVVPAALATPSLSPEQIARLRARVAEELDAIREEERRAR